MKRFAPLLLLLLLVPWLPAQEPRTIGTGARNTDWLLSLGPDGAIRWPSNIFQVNRAALAGAMDPLYGARDAAGVPAVSGALALTLADGHTGVVHPNILAMPTNWCGAQYWLVITGAGTNGTVAFEDHEQPHLFSSPDLVNWTPRGPQPLMARYAGTALAGWGENGWLADPEIYLDPSGTLRVLYCAFRTLAAGKFTNAVLCASTRDTTNWTHQVLHYAPEGTNATYAGPQIVRDHTNGLRLYYVDEGNGMAGTNKLFWVPGLDTSGTNWDWAATNTCTLLTYQDPKAAPWHFSMHCVGSTYHLFYGSQVASLGEYTTSADGTTWAPPGIGVFELPGLLTGTEYTTYKSALWPVAGAQGLAWNALVGTMPLGVGDATGWHVKLVRGLTVEPWRYGYLAGTNRVNARPNTNWVLLGNSKLYGNVSRVGALTVSDCASNGVYSVAGLGSPFSGWSALALGYNSPIASTNYVLGSDGVSETRLNARASGVVNFSVDNGVRGTVTSTNTMLLGTLSFTNATAAAVRTGWSGLWCSNGVLYWNTGGTNVKIAP